MHLRRTEWISKAGGWLLAAALVTCGGLQTASAQALVPGTGQQVADATDDFEDENWKFVVNWPKSSRNLDKRVREPTGYSENGYWFESPKRGQPDILKRVPTPEGGLPDSEGALRMQTLYTGVPGRGGRDPAGHQDDLLTDIRDRMNGSVPVSRSPSVVVRVYLPPFEEWEDHTGASFGFRASVRGRRRSVEERRGLGRLLAGRRKTTTDVDTFYPGMFIQFNSETDRENDHDSAVFILRSDDWGRDVLGPEITKNETGWWTLGLSFTPDGRVHYYASPGVDDLTRQDHLASYTVAGYRCTHFNTFFFNVCNQDDGRTWSTEWIIDDPSFYLGRR